MDFTGRFLFKKETNNRRRNFREIWHVFAKKCREIVYCSPWNVLGLYCYKRMFRNSGQLQYPSDVHVLRPSYLVVCRKAPGFF